MAGAILNYNNQAIGTPSGVYGINNLTPENIKNGVNIGGVVGSYQGSTQYIQRSLWVSSNEYSGLRTTITIDNLPSEPKIISLSNHQSWTNIYNNIYRVKETYSSVTMFYATIGNSTFIKDATTVMTYSYSNGTVTLTITTTKYFAGTYDVDIVC